MIRLIICIILFSSVFSNVKYRCPSNVSRDDRPELESFHESPSGHFLIHYDTSGDNAPLDMSDSNGNGLPDYIEEAALAADSARVVLTEQMGYISENEDIDGKYDIYILSLSSSLWGVTQHESTGSSFIKIRNTYNGMSNRCSDTNQLLWLTIGHEFFHAIQFSYPTNTPPGESDSYFKELTSMWFENIFVPECYDFLDFVDMSSTSLFNNPERGFDQIQTGSYGYSLALYAHYLSTIVDNQTYDNQTNSDIMRKIWERYSMGGTPFSAINEVLESEYDIFFIETWSNFMSRNMFSGYYPSMENSIYYHPAQIYIDSPNITYKDITTNIDELEIILYNDRVSIIGYDIDYDLTIETDFNFNNHITYFGNLQEENFMEEISGYEYYTTDIIFPSSKVFFTLSTLEESLNMNINFQFNNEGCTDSFADNYNQYALADDGSCIYSNKIYSIYPNPINLNRSQLRVNYINSNTDTFIIEIFDSKGNIVLYEKNNSPNVGINTYIPQLDNNLSSGLYFLRVNNNYTAKFINIK